MEAESPGKQAAGIDRARWSGNQFAGWRINSTKTWRVHMEKSYTPIETGAKTRQAAHTRGHADSLYQKNRFLFYFFNLARLASSFLTRASDFAPRPALPSQRKDRRPRCFGTTFPDSARSTRIGRCRRPVKREMEAEEPRAVPRRRRRPQGREAAARAAGRGTRPAAPEPSKSRGKTGVPTGN